MATPRLRLYLPIDATASKRSLALAELCCLALIDEVNPQRVAELVFVCCANRLPVTLFAEGNTIPPRTLVSRLSLPAAATERSIAVTSIAHLSEALSEWYAEEFFMVCAPPDDCERRIPASDAMLRLAPSGYLHRYVKAVTHDVPLFSYSKNHSSVEVYGFEPEVLRIFTSALTLRANWTPSR